jgi:diguanylate cyclase (GGDEF)-like protein
MRDAFRAETRRATRGSGLLLGAIGVVALLCWTGFDVALQPDNAAVFFALRVTASLAMTGTYLVMRTRAGERWPEQLLLVMVTIPQIAIAIMVSRLDGDYSAYAVGFSLAVYASAFLLVWPWHYTAAQILLTWAALGAALVTSPVHPGAEQIATVAFYVATASVLSLAGQWYRCRLAWEAFTVRWELQAEQAHSRELVARLERLSALDELTGLANRRSWDDRLGQAMAAARRSGRPLSVLVCDIDNFKQVNDRHGHVIGDRVLKHTASLIAGRIRRADLVARLGGDEFAILCPDTELSAALELGAALAELADGLALPDGAPVSFSIGAAALEQTDHTIDDLIRRADERMYAEKAQTRTRRDLRAA